MVTGGSALSEENVTLPRNQFRSTEVLAENEALCGGRRRPHMSLTAQIEGPIAVVYPRNLVLSLLVFFFVFVFLEIMTSHHFWRLSGGTE